jgi:hypothetical protein
MRDDVVRLSFDISAFARKIKYEEAKNKKINLGS